MDYSEKLRDPRWQKKRLEVMQRDNFRCRICHGEEMTLNVHHIEYEKKDPWDANGKNLVTLCEDCHGVVKHCATRGQRRSFEAILKQAWVCGKVAAGRYSLSDGATAIEIIPRRKSDNGAIRCSAPLGSPFVGGHLGGFP